MALQTSFSPSSSSSCSFSSSSFSYAWKYHVFLSFRGPDTRRGFIGHLHKALSDKGIRTYIDDEELQRGEEITPSLAEAIKESRIAIPVFSENYASSAFCLDELVKIMECVKRKGRLVLPVFYKVDPRNVRHQRGSYGEALTRHEKRFKDDKGKVQRWREALQQAANLSGEHFKPGNEYERDFIEKIVKEISKRISRVPLHVADHPVGLQSRVLEVNRLLNDGSDDGVHMVGIYGIGGIGKTTLAKAVYNSVADQFESLCFIENMSELSADRHGLVRLQEMVLSKILRDKVCNLGSVREGISIINERLRCKKVLLGLDNVDKHDQLQAIIGNLSGLGSGSRVIITTRNKHLLTTHKVKKVYEVGILNEKDAVELFSRNAFESGKGEPCYMDILKKLVTCASGLPLALEVIGSNLFGKSVEEWRSALDMYKKVPNGDVQMKLKVSYDALHAQEQNVFLDIACCFKGYGLTEVKRILHAHYDADPTYSIAVLVDKSLIKNYGDVITLHDLIQDMGRKIVRSKSPEEPGACSRLWLAKDIIEVLQGDKGTCKIQLINLECDYHGDVIEWDGQAFRKMKELRTLIIRKGRFSQGPKYLPSSLRVLKWETHPSQEYLPFCFHPKHLAILELSRNCFDPIQLTYLLQKKLENMTVLKFEGWGRITKIPNLSSAPKLEELSFAGCDNLTEIDASALYLDKLKTLNASGCRQLRSLPLLRMPFLERLELDGCNSLESFPEIQGKMEKMTKLSLHGVAIKKFPYSIHNLTRLRSSSMWNGEIVELSSSTELLEEVEEEVKHLRKGLLLRNEDEGEEQVSSMSFSNKTELDIENCNISEEFFRIALPMFPCLQSLILAKENFRILPECIEEFQFLWRLHLIDCEKLEEIRGIPPNIEELCVSNCRSLSSLTREMLLNKKLYEEGQDQRFILPGKRLPVWFEYQRRELPITFWLRNKFRAITFGVFDSSPPLSGCYICGILTINDRNSFHLGEYPLYSEKTRDGRIFIFSITQTAFRGEVDEALSENEWNRVVFSADYREPGRNKRKHLGCTVEVGVHIIKERSSVDDIRFTDPLPSTFNDNVNGNSNSKRMSSTTTTLNVPGSDVDSWMYDKEWLSLRPCWQEPLDRDNLESNLMQTASTSHNVMVQGLQEEQNLTSIDQHKLEGCESVDKACASSAREDKGKNPLLALSFLLSSDLMAPQTSFSPSSSSCSFSSSSFSYAWKYHVFLSFRGPDTRHGFIGHLHKALSDKGIRSFIDDEELQRGEEITPSLAKAIEESRIAIPVFSENYASSAFCLDELVKIMECVKGKGRLVLPVFYKVDPRDVRRQSGSYGEALARHEERFKDDKERVQQWREALRQAANLSGEDFKLGNEYERDLIVKIVKEISKKLSRVPLHVADYPVGLESQVLEVNRLLNVGSDDGVHMVGIYGIGGIGKTTLAKAVYNSVADQFEGLCFIENMSKLSDQYGLACLQEMVLSKILGDKTCDLGSAGEGISIIKERLRCKKVLLVLDNVDKHELFQAIGGSLSGLGSGSRVIITTQDKHLLTTHGVKKVYEVEESKSALDMYKKVLNENVLAIFKVSFDALHPNEKNIFLDIACCFKGYKLTEVISILQAHYDVDPRYSIRVLVDKSLIKIDTVYVTLPDLIQDMGREIIRLESPEEPGARSRLWLAQDVIEVLQGDKGSSKIQLINLECDYNGDAIEWDGLALKKMENLRTFIIKKCRFSQGHKHLPSSLRVLEWEIHPSQEYLQFDFHPKQLVIFNLSRNCFDSVQVAELLKKKFENMRVLKFDHCKSITKIPNLSSAPKLEVLSFAGCDSLIEIDESVGSLDKLETLNAEGCSKLWSLPPLMLPSLEALNLDFCSSLESFPEILGKMESMTHLFLYSVPIKKFPYSIHNLTRLRSLFVGNGGIVELPSSIMLLEEVETLRFSGCKGLLLPNEDEGEEQVSSMSFSNKIGLDIIDCNISEEFPRIAIHVFPRLESLSLNRESFRVLPECIEEFQFLRSLKLIDCEKLEEIRGIPPNIEELFVVGCTSLSLLTRKCIEEFQFLRKLHLIDCEKLEEIRGIPPNIEELFVVGGTSLSPLTRKMLLNKKLHEEGQDKMFIVQQHQQQTNSAPLERQLGQGTELLSLPPAPPSVFINYVNRDSNSKEMSSSTTTTTLNVQGIDDDSWMYDKELLSLRPRRQEHLDCGNLESNLVQSASTTHTIMDQAGQSCNVIIKAFEERIEDSFNEAEEQSSIRKQKASSSSVKTPSKIQKTATEQNQQKDSDVEVLETTIVPTSISEASRGSYESSIQAENADQPLNSLIEIQPPSPQPLDPLVELERLLLGSYDLTSESSSPIAASSADIQASEVVIILQNLEPLLDNPLESLIADGEIKCQILDCLSKLGQLEDHIPIPLQSVVAQVTDFYEDLIHNFPSIQQILVNYTCLEETRSKFLENLKQAKAKQAQISAEVLKEKVQVEELDAEIADIEIKLKAAVENWNKLQLAIKNGEAEKNKILEDASAWLLECKQVVKKMKSSEHAYRYAQNSKAKLEERLAKLKGAFAEVRSCPYESSIHSENVDQPMDSSIEIQPPSPQPLDPLDELERVLLGSYDGSSESTSPTAASCSEIQSSEVCIILRNLKPSLDNPLEILIAEGEIKLQIMDCLSKLVQLEDHIPISLQSIFAQVRDFYEDLIHSFPSIQQTLVDYSCLEETRSKFLENLKQAKVKQARIEVKVSQEKNQLEELAAEIADLELKLKAAVKKQNELQLVIKNGEAEKNKILEDASAWLMESKQVVKKMRSSEHAYRDAQNSKARLERRLAKLKGAFVANKP